MAALRNGLLCVAILLIGFGCATSSPVSTPGNDRNGAETGDSQVRQGAEVERPNRPAVAVVLNDPNGIHLELLRVFSARLGQPYEVFDLARRPAPSVRRLLAEMVPLRVVAIGPAALSAASAIPGVEIVYAAVLDPGDETHGIDALPPFDAQLDHWLAVAPRIARIGVVGGEKMHHRMVALETACVDRGLTLERREVASDTETLLAFRSMVPRIDGFVFLPDEAVLSPDVIRQVMTHGRRNGIQILVYSPVMFDLGATMLLQPDPVAVAVALAELVEDPDLEVTVREIRTRTNPLVPLISKAATPSVTAGSGDG